jgi:hypothetical protein
MTDRADEVSVEALAVAVQRIVDDSDAGAAVRARRRYVELRRENVGMSRVVRASPAILPPALARPGRRGLEPVERSPAR